MELHAFDAFPAVLPRTRLPGSRRGFLAINERFLRRVSGGQHCVTFRRRRDPSVTRPVQPRFPSCDPMLSWMVGHSKLSAAHH